MAKYIVVEKDSNEEALIIFDWETNHSDMARKIQSPTASGYVVGEVKSAGRIKFDSNGKMYCVMGSTSLKIQYEPTRDKRDNDLLEYTIKDY